MLISHKYKFITIDIPKTGTRSLRETIMPLNIIDIVGTPTGSNGFNQHGSVQSCIESLLNINKNFYDYYSFCIVRNPWDRYLSFFKYYRQFYNEFTNKPELQIPVDRLKQLEFCKKMFEENKKDCDILKIIILGQESQCKYFIDKNQKTLVNHVGKFEKINEEFNLLCNNVNIHPIPQLKHENQTEKIKYKDIYSQELVDIVAKKEKYIIEKYNYIY